MSHDTPTDPPPFIRGPGPDYDPPPVDTLTDPDLRTATATHGAELVRKVLAEKGITKTGGRWTSADTTLTDEES